MVERADLSSAPCQHHRASPGALALSECVLRASTCHLFCRRYARAAPCTCGAHVRPRQDEFFMLLYWQKFCNIFPAFSPPAWQGPGADGQRRSRPRQRTGVWCALGLAGSVDIPRSLQAAGLTRARLSAPRVPVSRTYALIQRSAASMWRTPQAGSLREDPATTPSHQPHALAMAATDLHAPACCAVIRLSARERHAPAWTRGAPTPETVTLPWHRAAHEPAGRRLPQRVRRTMGSGAVARSGAGGAGARGRGRGQELQRRTAEEPARAPRPERRRSTGHGGSCADQGDDGCTAQREGGKARHETHARVRGVRSREEVCSRSCAECSEGAWRA